MYVHTKYLLLYPTPPTYHPTTPNSIKFHTRDTKSLPLTFQHKSQMAIPNPQDDIILGRIIWPTPPPPPSEMSRFIQMSQVGRYCAEADYGWLYS